MSDATSKEGTSTNLGSSITHLFLHSFSKHRDGATKLSELSGSKTQSSAPSAPSPMAARSPEGHNPHLSLPWHFTSASSFTPHKLTAGLTPLSFTRGGTNAWRGELIRSRSDTWSTAVTGRVHTHSSAPQLSLRNSKQLQKLASLSKVQTDTQNTTAQSCLAKEQGPTLQGRPGSASLGPPCSSPTPPPPKHCLAGPGEASDRKQGHSPHRLAKRTVTWAQSCDGGLGRGGEGAMRTPYNRAQPGPLLEELLTVS